MWIGKVAIGPGDRTSLIIQKCPNRPGIFGFIVYLMWKTALVIYPADIVTGGLGEKKVFLINL